MRFARARISASVASFRRSSSASDAALPTPSCAAMSSFSPEPGQTLTIFARIDASPMELKVLSQQSRPYETCSLHTSLRKHRNGIATE